MNTPKKIAFTGGGTGGHIYPSLAVAAAFKEKHEPQIFYIGASRGMDRAIVEDANLPFYGICAGKLRRYVSLKNIIDLFKILIGFFQALKILAKERPALLFSKGGFVSVPPVLAAATLKIPVWTHESDFTPGLATKINARFAERVFTAYENTALFFPPAGRSKIICVGNPVRDAFRNADAERGRAFIARGGGGIEKDKKIMLVLGGSQGAKEINDLIAECLPELTQYFFIVHQTGAQPPSPKKTNAQLQKNYSAVPYIKNEMPDVLAAASLVVGRSGAGTVWEAATVGRPMLLIPLCGSGTRGDQVENAKYFAERGAACMLLHPTAAQLVEAISQLASNENRLEEMANQSKKIGEKNAARMIIDYG